VPSATSGIGAAIATSGSQSNSRRTFLDRLLQPQADLGFFDLEPADALACLGELLLGRGPFGAQAVELGTGRARGIRLFLAAPAQAVGELLGRGGPIGEPRRDHVDRVALVLELGAPGASAGFLVGTRREPCFDLGESRRETRAPFVDCGPS